MAKKSRSKTFWNLIRFKYKLSILNEKTLEEIFAFRLSILSVFNAGFLLFIATLLIVSTLIAITPIKNFLPGYLDINARQDIVSNRLRLDSLQGVINLQERYLAQVKSVLSGDIKIDSLTTNIDSLNNIDPEKLKASDEELNYRKQYEEDEKYNLSIKPVVHDESQDVAFIRPVKGVITAPFNVTKKHFGLTINTSPNSAVMAILQGDVILTGTQENGLQFIQIIHPNGFVSIYKNCSSLLKKVGQTVRTGEAIANTDNVGKNKKPTPFAVELWYKGKPVNPTQYIVF
ncbi:MAG: M23 family metallopeptidase [Bacteroidales bacterium]|nr:M23 family metallopeptidase [Bacteroidales bacterium]